MAPVVYINPPDRCDGCRGAFGLYMYDARTLSGQWGNFCRACFKVYCVGLGEGQGQMYERKDGEWRKVAG